VDKALVFILAVCTKRASTEVMRSPAASPEAHFSPRSLSDDIVGTDTFATALASHFMRSVADTQRYLQDPGFRDSLRVGLQRKPVEPGAISSDISHPILVIDGPANLHVECTVFYFDVATDTCRLTVPVAHASRDSCDTNVVEMQITDSTFAHLLHQAA
jgi:hypothetical protein